MIIAQISDFHMGKAGTAARARLALKALEAARPAPDLVIATGDLAEFGRPDGYRDFWALFRDFPAPVLPLVGNHDRRRAFRDALPPHVRIDTGPGDFIQYAWEAEEATILVLDTVDESSMHPAFCPARREWLADRLRAPRRKPVLIAMHHPPFPSGVAWLDPPDPGWSDPAGEAIESSGAVAHIFCAHVHRPIFRVWRGVPVTTAPAVASQVGLDLSGSPSGVPSAEPPGFLLHRFEGGRMTTYVACAEGFA